jgi:type IV secretion system protein VirB11
VLTGRGTERRLSELARVEGLEPDGTYRLLPIVQAQGAHT